MSKIAKNTDKAIQPSRSEENKEVVNFIDRANFDHHNDQDLNNLMRTIINCEMPIQYKLERCKLLIESFSAGLDMFNHQSNA